MMDAYDTTARSSDGYDILTGVWTNWSRGSVFGRTLTLQRRDGDLLIAFIALFVTIVGTGLWRVLCFGLHSFFSTEATSDGIYHQRQAILRNSANGTTGLVRFVQAMLAWRRRDSKPYRRIAPLILVTAIFISAFAAASGFSSRVSTGIGNEVLIQAKLLGVATGNTLTWSQYQSIWYPATSRSILSHATYAQECYTNDTSTANCNKYVKPRLNYEVQRNASCPFDSEMCKLSNENIFIDTGLLDFNDDFGVNLPPNRRFQFRQTTHCAPIVTEGYKQDFPEGNASWYHSDKNWTKPAHTMYYYGQAPFEEAANATYEYETNVPDFIAKLNTAPAFYSLGTRQVYGMNGTIHPASAFVPIPPLLRTDADTVLVFLSANEIGYTSPTSDPWYAANQLVGSTVAYADDDGGQDDKTPFYYRDEPAAVLGCVMRKQVCNPRHGGGGGGGGGDDDSCTALASGMDLAENLADIAGDGEEAWLLGQLAELLLNARPELWDIVNTLGSASLGSSFSLYNGVQAELPGDQWQRDVERWHSIVLASLQGSAVEIAEGPAVPELRAELRKPANGSERALCRRQKVMSTAHSNFSVFGLAFIFTTGGLIILASWFLEPIAAYVQRRRKLDSYARLEWCANETLQLQRLAHEELGMGTWSKCDGEVPVTEKGERLAVVDLTDAEHPRLKARPMGWEEAAVPGLTGGMETVKDDGRRSADGDASSCGGGVRKDPRCSVQEDVSPVSPSAPGSVDGSTLANFSCFSPSLENQPSGAYGQEDEREATRERV